MKTTFEKTLAKLSELSWLKMADRDFGQLDHYEGAPPVIFPCALISISMPKRKNLTTIVQQRGMSVKVRYAFERLRDSSSLTTDAIRQAALNYYELVEQADELFQGFSDDYFTGAWECTGTIEEQRPDFDIVSFTYTTSIVK